MSSKTVYGVIGILVIAVVVLTGLVGYLYGQKPQTLTETNSQTITVTKTSTYTQIVTNNNTYTYPSSQTQTNQYQIEATAEPISGGMLQVTIKVSGPAEDILIVISDTDGKTVAYVPILKINLLDGVETAQTYITKEGLYTFIIARQSDGVELYRTTIALTGVFSRFEKLEISSAYATSATSIVLNVQNTGSSDATIIDIFINGKPEASFSPTGTAAPTCPISLTSGTKTTITITMASALISGVTYDFKIHTAAGNDYPKAVVIP